VSYVSGNYQIELWLRYSEFDGYGPFTIYVMLNETYHYNQTESLNINILGLTTSQIESPIQDQTYDSDEILTIVLSYDDSIKSVPIDIANIQWKVGLGGTLSNENVSFNVVSENYEIELWLSSVEFDEYGSFIIYFELNKANYYNNTESLALNILGLTTSQIDNPSQDQTFYSNETLLIELSFDDFIKGIPILGATIEWKVGNMGNYSNAGVSYPGTGNYEISILLSLPDFDGHGPFTIYINLNKTNYYNQTESLNFNVIGLTSISIVNITQYQQQLSLNGSIYEAQAGENMTIYANFINLYPNKVIIGAVGILTFNGEDYMSFGNLNGTFGWEINAYLLPFGLYNFSITFNKTFHENSTSLYEVRVNNLIAKIRSIQKPVEVRQGDSFDLTLELYYELYNEFAINNANISLIIDFGPSTSIKYSLTNSSGIAHYKIAVPDNAIRIIITAFYSGNGTYTSASLEITDIELIPVEEGGIPFGILIFIIIGSSLGVVLISVIILKKKAKKKNLVPEKEVPVKPESKTTEKSKLTSTEEIKEKIVEVSKTESAGEPKEKIVETSKPVSMDETKEKKNEHSKPTSTGENIEKTIETPKSTSSEKKKVKKVKKAEKSKSKKAK